jgi:hypothetical protein
MYRWLVVIFTQVETLTRMLRLEIVGRVVFGMDKVKKMPKLLSDEVLKNESSKTNWPFPSRLARAVLIKCYIWRVYVLILTLLSIHPNVLTS